MRAIHLKTEYLKNPIGIDIEKPFLSWNCCEGKKQTAYEIQAVSDGRVVWESGKVNTDRMNGSFGVPAGSRQQVIWKVRLWDEHGTAGEWSEEASFEMGILERV